MGWWRAHGEIAEVEKDVGTHRVVGEVMFDAPQRIDPERLGEIAEAKLVPIDVAIGSSFALALKNDAHSDVHLAPLLRWPCGPVSTRPRHHRPGLREASSVRGLDPGVDPRPWASPARS